MKNGTLKLATNETLNFASSIFIIIKNDVNENLGFVNQESKNTNDIYDCIIQLNEMTSKTYTP